MREHFMVFLSAAGVAAVTLFGCMAICYVVDEYTAWRAESKAVAEKPLMVKSGPGAYLLVNGKPAGLFGCHARLVSEGCTIEIVGCDTN